MEKDTSDILATCHVENLPSQQGDGVHTEMVASPQLSDAQAREYTGFWSKNTMKLLPIVTIGFLSVFPLPATHKPAIMLIH